MARRQAPDLTGNLCKGGNWNMLSKVAMACSSRRLLVWGHLIARTHVPRQAAGHVHSSMVGDILSSLHFPSRSTEWPLCLIGAQHEQWHLCPRWTRDLADVITEYKQPLQGAPFLLPFHTAAWYSTLP